jgi:hypothetical protein
MAARHGWRMFLAVAPRLANGQVINDGGSVSPQSGSIVRLLDKRNGGTSQS